MCSLIIERVLRGDFTLIAEIGVNYYDIAHLFKITPMEAAKKMIDEAVNSGIHAVKFQTYKAGTLAVRNSPSYWDLSEEPTNSQYELFKKFDAFGEKEYTELSRYCAEKGIEFFSTAFDFNSADYLNKLMNVYKISSSDLNNLPFIKHQAKKDKPILMSTGASSAEEIDSAVSEIRKANNKPLVIMHCVLEYPTPQEHANLMKIASIKSRYPDVIIGYSDHTVPSDTKEIITTAYLLGAVVVEKHFTLDKTLKGNDHYHAMNPADAKDIIERIKRLNIICGDGNLTVSETESPARQNARRSVISARAIKKGETITTEMLTYKRPGNGISPSDFNKLLGLKAVTDISEDTILQWDMFEKRF